ncbi:uncharacterized protein G2W53_027284 [Senna tora]|uniref:Uncharacterized protein n=1 Tax=Senna tora TaxID=362788 RepID=A0A834TIR6_9FABA|nr:uncharacterized protein G2W53_027284 [Senna tora]
MDDLREIRISSSLSQQAVAGQLGVGIPLQIVLYMAINDKNDSKSGHEGATTRSKQACNSGGQTSSKLMGHSKPQKGERNPVEARVPYATWVI